MRSDITKLTVPNHNFANKPKNVPNIKHDDSPSNGSQVVPNIWAGTGGHGQTNRQGRQT
jgi:hypothetical protein